VPVVCSLDEERLTKSDSDEGTFNGLGGGTYSPDDDSAHGNGIPAAVTNVSSPPSSSVSFASFVPSSGLLRLGMYTPFLFPAVTALLRVLSLRGRTRLGPEPEPEPPPSVVPLSGLDSRGSRSRDVSLGCGASIGVSTLCRIRCVGRPARGEGTSREAEVGKAPRSAANSSCPMTRGVSAERDTVNEDREGGFLIVIGRVVDEGAYGAWNASKKSSGHLP
jgi:hypothetical protein